YADPKQGLATSDNNRFRRDWSEVSIKKSSLSDGNKWFPYNSGGGFRKWFGNQYYFLNWENDGIEIKNFEKSVIRSPQYYFNSSISWSKISAGGLGVRYFPEGFIFDVAGCSIFEKKKGINKYLLALLNSNLKKVLIESIAPTLNYEVGQLSNVPVIINNDSSYESLVDNNISISKKDWDSRETSWDFEQSPLLGIRGKGLGNSDKGSVSLKAAYEAWVAEVSQDFFQLHANEEELNRIFIDIYGLQDELTPEVALKDITILQDELKAEDLEALEGLVDREKGLLGNSEKGLGNSEEGLGNSDESNHSSLTANPLPLTANHSSLAPNRSIPSSLNPKPLKLPIQANVVMQQFISYLVGTLLGRYRLGQKGLHIAHPNPTDEELSEYLVIGGKG